MTGENIVIRAAARGVSLIPQPPDRVRVIGGLDRLGPELCTAIRVNKRGVLRVLSTPTLEEYRAIVEAWPEYLLPPPPPENLDRANAWTHWCEIVERRDRHCDQSGRECTRDE